MFWFIIVNRKMLWAFYVNITNNISYHISTSVLSKNQYKIIFWDRQIQITKFISGIYKKKKLSVEKIFNS